MFMKLNKVFPIIIKCNVCFMLIVSQSSLQELLLSLKTWVGVCGIMPCTRSSSSLCRKRTREESSGQCVDCSHIKMIANLKREILELKKSLDVESEQRIEPLRERTALNAGGVTWKGEHAAARVGDVVIDNTVTKATINSLSEAHRYTLHELELCKRELQDTREALQEACEEREALRIKLSESQTTKVAEPKETASGMHKTGESHPHLDWVGRHYLTVSLLEDRMFKPGQSVTPVGVLQKLFEMRVGDKLATGFSVLLENINIMLSQLEPEWYAKHFGFCRAYMHGNKYKSTDRVDTEDFAWLLFEYGAHALLIEVLAGLLNVLNSMGMEGVTIAALYMSKNMYNTYVTLFRDTASRAYEGFMRIRERAQKVRKAQGLVYMPLTAGLGADQSLSQGGSHSVRNRVLCSVLEGIEAPPHISSASASAEVDRVSHEDPLRLEQSLSAFMKHRGLESQGKEGRSSVHRNNQEHFPFEASTSSAVPVPLEKRVLFDSPWSNDLPTL